MAAQAWFLTCIVHLWACLHWQNAGSTMIQFVCYKLLSECTSHIIHIINIQCVIQWHCFNVDLLKFSKTNHLQPLYIVELYHFTVFFLLYKTAPGPFQYTTTVVWGPRCPTYMYCTYSVYDGVSLWGKE